MLEQKYRFHGYGSLRFVYQRGKTYRARTLVLRMTHNPKRVHGRCAVVVARKVLKSAVGRNRIRRRVYEIIRTNWDNIAPSHDMVLTVYDKAAATMPHDQLEAQIIQLLKDARIWQTRARDRGAKENG